MDGGDLSVEPPFTQSRKDLFGSIKNAYFGTKLFYAAKIDLY